MVASSSSLVATTFESLLYSSFDRATRSPFFHSDHVRPFAAGFVICHINSPSGVCKQTGRVRPHDSEAPEPRDLRRSPSSCRILGSSRAYMIIVEKAGPRLYSERWSSDGRIGQLNQQAALAPFRADH